MDWPQDIEKVELCQTVNQTIVLFLMLGLWHVMLYSFSMLAFPRRWSHYSPLQPAVVVHVI